ncbi:hypothetical protein D3C76_1657610 [compost metagenome]
MLALSGRFLRISGEEMLQVPPPTRWILTLSQASCFCSIEHLFDLPPNLVRCASFLAPYGVQNLLHMVNVD